MGRQRNLGAERVPKIAPDARDRTGRAIDQVNSGGASRQRGAQATQTADRVATDQIERSIFARNGLSVNATCRRRAARSRVKARIGPSHSVRQFCIAEKKALRTFGVGQEASARKCHLGDVTENGSLFRFLFSRTVRQDRAPGARTIGSPRARDTGVEPCQNATADNRRTPTPSRTARPL